MKFIQFNCFVVFGAALLALGGCQETAPTDTPGARIDMTIAPLTLEGVGNVRWRVTVRNGAAIPETVWTRELESTRFGNGRGDISYVGPCDASPGVQTHTVTLELLEIRDLDGELIPDTDYVNPTVPTPIVVDAQCSENADTPVQFNIIVMRRANQGFFDVAIDFDNVFCSAKMDCSDDFLLYPGDDPQGRTGRGPTAIMAFACTAGEDGAGQPRPTYLYLNEVKVSCPRANPTPAEVVYVHPTGGPGNLGRRDPLLFQTSLTFGREAFTNLNKCYWNLALGVELDQITDGPCQVTVAGTASTTALGGHQTPAGQVWPVVGWDVTLDVVAGKLACGVNPLDGAQSGVTTTYVGPDDPAFFTYQMACTDPDPEITSQQTCAVPFEGKTFSFGRSQAGILVSYDGIVASVPYTLPNAGWQLSDAAGNAGCCADNCCQ